MNLLLLRCCVRIAFLSAVLLLCGCAKHYHQTTIDQTLDDCRALAKKRTARIKAYRPTAKIRKNKSTQSLTRRQAIPATTESTILASQDRDAYVFVPPSIPGGPLEAPLISLKAEISFKPLEPHEFFSERGNSENDKAYKGASAAHRHSPAATPSADYLLLFGLTGGPALVSLLVLALFPYRSMRISAWAAHHPVVTKGILAGIHTGTCVGAWMTGNYLFQQGIYISDLVMAGAASGALTAYAFYPGKSSSLSFFRYHYLREKLHHAAMYATGATLLMYAGNHSSSTYNPNQPVVSYYHVYQQSIQSDKPEKLSQHAGFTPHKTYQETPKKKKGNLTGLKVLAIVLFALLTMSVAVLACSLACSNEAVLAGVVLIGGEAALIAGLIAALRSINRKKKEGQKEEESVAESSLAP